MPWDGLYLHRQSRFMEIAGVLGGQSQHLELNVPYVQISLVICLFWRRLRLLEREPGTKHLRCALYTMFVDVHAITGCVSSALLVFPEMRIGALRCCPPSVCRDRALQHSHLKLLCSSMCLCVKFFYSSCLLLFRHQPRIRTKAKSLFSIGQTKSVSVNNGY